MSSTIVVKSANTRKAEYICSCRMCSYVEWQTVLFRFPQFLPRNENQSDWPTTIATFSIFDFYVCFSAQLNPLVCSSLSFIRAGHILVVFRNMLFYIQCSAIDWNFACGCYGYTHDPRGCEGSGWPSIATKILRVYTPPKKLKILMIPLL